MFKKTVKKRIFLYYIKIYYEKASEIGAVSLN